ncbi:YicC/YloC family endoribonuclease [Rhodohalobacter sp. 614A]|uniref:YicC/YloC family endoribonuclease n=1 Tax=Rhodohalobacter sp. 614A TaxID=2908649 RepID=UPI001F29F093|nr:YicC/YloC family endoribonuclease [Rhodohalobacter sp. 614A]
MIKSMTGFGRGESSSDGFQVTVEIKTLNSRYLDVSIRVPQSIQEYEFDIKEEIQKKLSRGKVHVNVNVDKTEQLSPDITYNEELIKAYTEMLTKVKNLAGIEEPIQMKDLLRFDNIFESQEEDEEDIEVIWRCTQYALGKSIVLLNEMRQKEGEELRNDLSELIEGIAEIVETVKGLSEKRAPEVREKLQNRISSMINEENIDPDRLEMEVALLVDKMDINEEIIRLQSHLKFFLEALDNDEPVGRRLNFLSQEINRELNTIGAKSNDSTIAHHIVLGKEKLEKIREQVQNIE